ncbi:MAG: hypothetical protein GXP48_10995, partial [Acidobacteria bacterium]|nr:hypothetical protein [Acidobacteriota bacterium]
MNGIEKVIANSVTPSPPAGLRARVLEAARRAALEDVPVPWWWRPAARWAWAGVTAALLAA